MRKNVKFLMCLVVAGLAFASCEKDEENGGGGNRTITATVENGARYNAEIDTVYAGFEWDYIDDEGYDMYGGYVLIDKAPYNNGGFSITLPETVDDKYLHAISDGLESLTVSDNTVKSLTISDFDAVKNGERVASIYKSNIDKNEVDIYDLERDEFISFYANGVYTVYYLYVNKPLTITGSYVDDEYFDDIELETNFDLSLQKGWNTVVIKITLGVSATGEVTGTQNYSSNSEPAGLKWYCSPGYVY